MSGRVPAASHDRPAHNARGRETREEILRATLRVIAERRISGTTHRSIAEAAGVPAGAPTYYFGTLDQLLQEALLLFGREETERLHELAAGVEELDDPDDELLADVFSRAVADTHVGQPMLVLAQFELYLEAARSDEIHEAAAACIAAYRNLAATVLRASGREDAEAAAGRFIAICDGLALHQLADPVPDYARDVLRPALLALLRGHPRV